MAAVFAGFSPQALAFFRQLRRNNDRDWFQPRKDFYKEQLIAPMHQLVNLVNVGLRRFAADHVTEPGKAVYRIYRDTRFSSDKTPYKTHIAAIFPRRGLSKHGGAGFYFQISDEALEIAGGIYMPGPEELMAVRRAIAGDPQVLPRILQPKKRSRPAPGPLFGEKLNRVPRPFPPDHPAGEYLRMKQWYYDITLDTRAVLRPTLPSLIVAYFRSMAPLIHYFNNALLETLQREPSPVPARPEPMF